LESSSRISISTRSSSRGRRPGRPCSYKRQYTAPRPDGQHDMLAGLGHGPSAAETTRMARPSARRR
jgi:hypothetical protein